MGGLDGCRGGGGRLNLVVLVSEILRKSQRILFICGAGNPVEEYLYELCQQISRLTLENQALHKEV